MTSIYFDLSERIRLEMIDLERSVQKALKGWSRAESALEDSDVFLDSVALNLHGFYSGLERLFELTARLIDRSILQGDSRHQDLLKQMARDVDGRRPALISEGSLNGLDELRRFRHRVRNIYATNLDGSKMEPMMSRLPATWTLVRAELLAFADFLEARARFKQTGE